VIETSGPEGNFYYEDMRDAKTVIAIAGGCGITPFFSMAQAIRDGIEDFNLYLIYGCKTLNESALKKELDEIAANNSRER
jgi:ferredoxin-NADP reductase